MLEEILDSKVKLRIAKLFSQRKEWLSVSDVGRISETSKSRASECLRDLHSKGILERRLLGRSVLYRLGSNDLSKMVEKALTQDRDFGLKIRRRLTSELKKLKPVSIVLFGSSVNKIKTESDIDILIISKRKIDTDKVNKIAADSSQDFGIQASIINMEKDEFKRKAKEGEEFIINLIATHKLLFGEKLEDLVWPKR